MNAPKHVTLILSNFGHDVNGNTIAKHTIVERESFLSNFGKTLYETKRRKQTGSGDYLDSIADVFNACGLTSKNYLLVLTEGSRNINEISFHLTKIDN